MPASGQKPPNEPCLLGIPDPLPLIDGLLAATAKGLGLTLVTRNVADVAVAGEFGAAGPPSRWVGASILVIVAIAFVFAGVLLLFRAWRVDARREAELYRPLPVLAVAARVPLQSFGCCWQNVGWRDRILCS